MIVKAIFKKALPARQGTGRNGDYDYRPFIIEFEEESASGTVTQALVIELSAKRCKVDELTKIVGTAQKVELYLGFDVREYQGKYYTDQIVFVRDTQFKLDRERSY